MNSASDIFWLLDIPAWTAVGINLIVLGLRVREVPEPRAPCTPRPVQILGCTCPDCVHAASRFGVIRALPTPATERIEAA